MRAVGDHSQHPRMRTATAAVSVIVATDGTTAVPRGHALDVGPALGELGQALEFGTVGGGERPDMP